MIVRQSQTTAFSLVEITLALGVMAICLLAVLGLLAIASNTNRLAAADTAAASIASAILADIRATPASAANSIQFGIPFGSKSVRFFDAEGQASTNVNETSIYRADIAFPNNSAGANAAVFVYVKISWPAAASLTDAAGNAETFCALNRH